MRGPSESLELSAASPTAKHANDIVTSLAYLKRDDIHIDIKPYRLQYHPGGTLPRTNCEHETREGIVIRDLRSRLDDFSFDTNGFDVLEIESELSVDEFYDKSRVQEVFYPEITALLSRYFSEAKEFVIMEHQLRKRHPNFPVSIGGDYEQLQPTTLAHIDFTLESALEASRDVLKMKNSDYRRIQCVNLWKPLRGPVTDWPLAICDSQTVDEDEDCIVSDVVTRTGYTENYQIYYSPKQRWYYLSRQLASEMIIFKQADTKAGYSGVPHTGFYNPKVAPGEKPRESLELRAFIYY